VPTGEPPHSDREPNVTACVDRSYYDVDEEQAKSRMFSATLSVFNRIAKLGG
jgi:hypothetical protein